MPSHIWIDYVYIGHLTRKEKVKEIYISKSYRENNSFLRTYLDSSEELCILQAAGNVQKGALRKKVFSYLRGTQQPEMQLRKAFIFSSNIQNVICAFQCFAFYSYVKARNLIWIKYISGPEDSCDSKLFFDSMIWLAVLKLIPGFIRHLFLVNMAEWL